MKPDDPKATPTSITQFWMDRIIAEKQDDAVAAERERITAEVKALPVLVLPTGTYVNVEGVYEAIAP